MSSERYPDPMGSVPPRDFFLRWSHLHDLQPEQVESPTNPDGIGPVSPRLEVDDAWQALRHRADGGPPLPRGAAEDASPGARALLELFGPLLNGGGDGVVVGQLAQSLDGRIATESGHSHYVSGPEDLVRLHRLRALMDAVVVGAATVEADDPRLTVRRVEGLDPVRVVLDPRARLSPRHKVFSDGTAPTLWLQMGARPVHPPGLPTSVEVICVPEAGAGGAAWMDPRGVRELLRERGLGRVLVEGGGRTVSAFLAAGALDRLHLTVAPILMGSGRPGLTLPAIRTMDQAIRPKVRRHELGHDLLFDLDLTGTSAHGEPTGG